MYQKLGLRGLQGTPLQPVWLRGRLWGYKDSKWVWVKSWRRGNGKFPTLRVLEIQFVYSHPPQPRPAFYHSIANPIFSDSGTPFWKLIVSRGKTNMFSQDAVRADAWVELRTLGGLRTRFFACKFLQKPSSSKIHCGDETTITLNIQGNGYLEYSR